MTPQERQGREAFEAAADGVLAPGDRVCISNPERGSVEGKVLHAVRPNALPALAEEWGELRTETVRQILREWTVSQIVLITYRFGHGRRARDVCFFALHTEAGWYDLKRQALTIERTGIRRAEAST